MTPHQPDCLGWFTNTSSPVADIVDWCRGKPGLRIEAGLPMVSAVTYTEAEMKRRKIVGLYVKEL